MNPFHNPGDAFGVYVHWPYCAAKCPYCDFNSHVRYKPVDQTVFREAYVREISHMARLAPQRMATSIFFGGGTPSLMESSTVAAILDAIDRRWGIAADAEITLEANPSSADASRFRGYHEAGVNRLSLGVQSFDDRQLKFLGRLHDSAEAMRAIALARETFPRISFDLIYARPGQSPEDWQAELGRALELAADHLSLYQLTIEEGTPFFDLHSRGRLTVPDPDAAATLYEITGEICRAAGMPAYEISNHAVPGAESRHNLVYWRYQDYAGIGPGAHGRLTVNESKLATATQRNPEAWWQKVMVEGHGLVEEEWLDPQSAADEMMLMGLRLREGVDLARLNVTGARSIDAGRLDALVAEGLVERLGESRIRVTPGGALVLDAVVADLLA